MREVWGTGKWESALFWSPCPWQQKGLSEATQPTVWLPPVIGYLLPMQRVIWAPLSFHSGGPWGLVIVGSGFSLFLKLTPGPLRDNRGRQGRLDPSLALLFLEAAFPALAVLSLVQAEEVSS